jgi:cell division protein FtsQ
MAKRKSMGKNVYSQIWQERFLRLWHLVLVLAVMIPLGYTGYLLYNRIFKSDIFMIKETKVEGYNKLTKTDIQNAIHIPKGSRLFDIKIGDIAQRLKTHPYVKNVSVRRIFPQTLAIELQEREPYVVLVRWKKYYEIDREGYVLKIFKNPKSYNQEQPLVKGLRYLKGKLLLGQKVNSHKVKKAIEVMNFFLVSDVAMSLTVKEINMGNIKQVILITKEGIKIQLGGSEFKEKLESLAVLLEQKKESIFNASYVDLRFGGVIIRPKRIRS